MNTLPGTALIQSRRAPSIRVITGLPAQPSDSTPGLRNPQACRLDESGSWPVAACGTG
jgi:hypothetical protein